MFNSEAPFAAEKMIAVSRSQVAGESQEQKQRDIFDSHRHRIFALAYYMTGNELDAEHVLSQTFIDAFRSASEPNAQGIDSALISELRGQLPLGQLEPVAVAASAPGLGSQNVRRTDLEEAVLQLPATERLLFLLLDVEGYTIESAADLLQMPKPDVVRAAYSARIRMRAILGSVVRDSAA